MNWKIMVAIALITLVVSTALFYFFLPYNVEKRVLHKRADSSTPQKIASINIQAGKITTVEGV